MQMVFFYLRKSQFTIFAPMETIPRSDCQSIGFIRKTHGVRGEMLLEYEPQYEASIESIDRLFLEINGLLVPFFLAEEGFRYLSAESAIIRFEHLDTERDARRLVSHPVYLFRSEIEKEADINTPSDFRNFSLFDEHGNNKGIISKIDDYAGNVVLTVEGADGPVLVPFNSELLHAIDLKNQTISLRIPEGLL